LKTGLPGPKVFIESEAPFLRIEPPNVHFQTRLQARFLHRRCNGQTVGRLGKESLVNA
jgi:hypothetical protein